MVFFHHSLRNKQAAPHNRTKYQQTTCAMQFSPHVFLHGFCPVFQHAERDTYSRLCWSKFSIRLVGTVKLVCFLCEFWWWKMQFEYGCVWIFFSSLTSPPTAEPHNRTKWCQQTTCAMQFSPFVFLHGFCPVFQHAERDTCSRLCWSKFSIRSVGTVKIVCFLCEFWWWKVQLDGFGCFCFHHSLHHQHQQHHTTAKNTSNNLRNAIFTMCVLA